MRRDEVERLPVRLGLAREGAEHAQILAHDGGGFYRRLALSKLADDDVARAAPRDVEPFRKGLRVAGEFHDDIGAAPLRHRPDLLCALLVRRTLDGQEFVGAELTREVEPGVRRTDRDDPA